MIVRYLLESGQLPVSSDYPYNDLEQLLTPEKIDRS